MWSLLEDYSQIYQDIHFRDSKLLVDGTNLAHDLYHRANLDQNHGGEYLAFQTKVQAFFKTGILSNQSIHGVGRRIGRP